MSYLTVNADLNDHNVSKLTDKSEAECIAPAIVTVEIKKGQEWYIRENKKLTSMG